MAYILTLVAAAENLSDRHFTEIEKIIAAYGLHYTGKPAFLDIHKAGHVGISDTAQFSLVQHLREFLAKDRIDFFITSTKNRQKKLLLADMDSTIAVGETLDDLAEHAGLKDKIAAITALAMEGKLDFHQAIRERVALLKGLNTSALDETLAKTKLNKNADIFVKTMRAHGATCVLVSGGFKFFTSAIAKQAGFEFDHGNELGIENNQLSGLVIDPILDKHAKVDFLKKYMEKHSLTTEDCLTIGDGANDLPMLKMASLGIGYYPKDAVKAEITNCILYGDFTAALYAQGYSSNSFKKE